MTDTTRHDPTGERDIGDIAAVPESEQLEVDPAQEMDLPDPDDYADVPLGQLSWLDQGSGVESP